MIYNGDWTQDLDGSDPGQDSEEIAKYYVMRRTDPETGRKPWILALRSGTPHDSPLNRTVLPRSSSDNSLGLILRGQGKAPQDRGPKSSAHGDAAVPFSMLESVRAPGRFAGFFVRRSDIENGPWQRLVVEATGASGNATTLLDARDPNLKPHPALSTFRSQQGLLLAADLLTLGKGPWKLEVRLEGPNVEARVFSASYTLDTPGAIPQEFRPVAESAEKAPFLLPTESGPLPRLLTLADLITRTRPGRLFGYLLSRKELESLNPKGIRLTARREGSADAPFTLYDEENSRAAPDGAIWKLSDGGLFVSTTLAQWIEGTLVAEWSGTPKEAAEPWSKRIRLYDPRELELSETGPDGIRDDQTYLDLIERPILEFLRTHETDDGIPLIDHVLYIVAVHGLPYQVSSLYGINRGVITANGGDIGSGSALTQRLMLIRYQPPQERRSMPQILFAGKDHAKLVRPIIAHPLRSALLGGQFHPLLHPLTHNKPARKRALENDGIRAVSLLAYPPLTTASRRALGEERTLYGSGRIEGRSVEAAKSQIDGAIYAESYLTPEMGPAFHGRYQEGTDTALAVKERGFEVHRLEKEADRALFFFGVLHSGKPYDQDAKTIGGYRVVWRKGFLPGSVGYATRSFLGWDRNRPPSESTKIFEQMVRGGATCSAGSAGGAHDTNLTWPDSFVLLQLLLDGYEYGDAILRSIIYLDWTLSVVGDPLYRPCLAETVVDSTAPKIATRDDIQLEVFSAGGGHWAVRATALLANKDPEMVESRLICRPVKGTGKEVFEGSDTLFTSKPAVTAYPLAPDTVYEVDLILCDPYGNSFSTRDTFGPLLVRTGPAPESRIIKETRLDSWLGKDTLRFDPGVLDECADIDVTLILGKGKRPFRIRTASGKVVFDFGHSLAVGGAAAGNSAPKGYFEAGREYRLRIRWRRRPLTREVYLVARDGTEHLLSSANRLPWDPAFRVGDKLVIEASERVTEVIVRDNPSTAPYEHRGMLPRKFEPEDFEKANSKPR